MPQLDISTYISQAFWVILCFSFLWLFLAIFVTPKIADIQEQRKRKIYDYLQKAEKLNNQAKLSLEKYQNSLERAKKKAFDDFEQNKKEMSEHLIEAEYQLNQKLNQKFAESEFILAKEKNETLQQIENLSQDIAFDIIQKMGFSSISKRKIATVTKGDNLNGGK